MKRQYFLISILFILLLALVSCGTRNQRMNNYGNKKYTLVLLREKFREMSYDMIDTEDDIDKILIGDSGEKVFERICILTNDSILIAHDLSNERIKFRLYTLQKIDDFTLLLKYEENKSKDSLLLSVDVYNNILKINDNKYFVNTTYKKYLLQEGFEKKSIQPFFSFINEYIDDFYPFHSLVEYRWLKDPTPLGCKILSATIITEHPQIDHIHYTWTVEYIDNGSHMADIIKYNDTNSEYYHFRYANTTSDYIVYEYTYSDAISRFYDEGRVYMNMGNGEDSVSYARTNNQKGQVYEIQRKIIKHNVYKVDNLYDTVDGLNHHKIK